MSGEAAWFTLLCKAETAKAVLLSDTKTESWVPKSRIVDQEANFERGEKARVELPLWLAEKIGFETIEE